MNQPKTPWTTLAVVTQPHGLKGQVKIKSFCEPPEGFASYALTDEAGKAVKLRITAQQAQGLFLVSIDGLTDRNEAERWRGRKLGAAVAAPADNRFLVSDLVGLEVIGADGAVLGTVSGVANYGASDLLEITDLTGMSQYYAFTNANFPELDMDARRITLTPPELLGSREEEEGRA